MDDSKLKPTVGAVYPFQVLESAWNRVEPLLTPDKLKSRFLFGIPLVSRFKDPISGKNQVMTDDILQDYINRAVNVAEVETHLDIMPVERAEVHAWDRALYMSFGYFSLEHRPCSAIELLSVQPPSGGPVFIVPPEWIDTGALASGARIQIIPLLVALGISGTGVVQATTAGAAVFLSLFSNRTYIPNFWQVKYISGFNEGRIPTIVNDLIGTIAAIQVLSSLAATFARTTSAALGVDGLSQSVGMPGPQIFMLRIQELEEQKKMLTNKLRTMYGQKLFSSSV